jgi:hypothetical protein
MPNKKLNVEISTFVAKNFHPTSPSFANIKKIPSTVGETQAQPPSKKRGKMKNCHHKNPPAAPSPCSNWPPATDHRPLLLPTPQAVKIPDRQKVPPIKTP